MSGKPYHNSNNALEIKRRVADIRGVILQEQITCEQLLTSILIHYYGENCFPQQERIHRDLISELSFRRKNQLVLQILKEYKFESILIKQIRKDLEHIRGIRNQLAHSQWKSISENDITFGTSNKQITLDQNFVDSFRVAIKRVEKPLLDFLFKEFVPK